MFRHNMKKFVLPKEESNPHAFLLLRKSTELRIFTQQPEVLRIVIHIRYFFSFFFFLDKSCDFANGVDSRISFAV